MGTPRDTRYDFDNGWTDDNDIDINRFFGSYDVPSPKEVENIIMSLVK